jgi:hypothetical protein
MVPGKGYGQMSGFYTVFKKTGSFKKNALNEPSERAGVIP